MTDDEGTAVAALRKVLGLPAEAGALTWEPGTPALIGTILGPGSAGTVEVDRLPDELRGHLTPPTTSISVAVDDLVERVAACRAAGLDVSVAPDAPGGLAYAVVTVAGLEFELVRFGRS